MQNTRAVSSYLLSNFSYHAIRLNMHALDNQIINMHRHYTE